MPPSPSPSINAIVNMSPNHKATIMTGKPIVTRSALVCRHLSSGMNDPLICPNSDVRVLISGCPTVFIGR